MICKFCGSQIADDSTFCINCGNSVAVQPQYAYQPVPQQPVYDENYNNALQYIETANSILGPAVKAFIFSLVFTMLIGNIYAIVKRKQIKKKISGLPLVDESLLDPVTYEKYKTARGKVTASRRFSKIAYVLSVFLFVLIAILIVELVVLAILLLSM